MAEIALNQKIRQVRNTGTTLTCSKSETANERGRVPTHMGLWSILAAPLLAGNDLSRMTLFTVELLTNRSTRVWRGVSREPGGTEVWMGPRMDGSKVVGLFNRQ